MALFEKKTFIINEIDYDKLANAIMKTQKNHLTQAELEKTIVSAIETQKELEKNSIEVEKEKQKDEWRKTIGLTMVKEDSSKFEKKKNDLLNSLRFLHFFILYKREYAKNVKMTFAIMGIISSIVFCFIELAFLFISVLLVYGIVFKGIQVIYLLLVLVILLLAKLIHIIRMEIDQMQDKDMINMIFSSLMAFIAALFTVLSFLKNTKPC